MSLAPAEPLDAEAPAQPAAEAEYRPGCSGDGDPPRKRLSKKKNRPRAPEQVGDRLRRMGAALTLRCALGGILALVLLHFGLAAEGLVGPLGGLDPVTAPAAFYAADLLFLAPWRWLWAGPS